MMSFDAIAVKPSISAWSLRQAAKAINGSKKSVRLMKAKPYCHGHGMVVVVVLLHLEPKLSRLSTRPYRCPSWPQLSSIPSWISGNEFCLFDVSHGSCHGMPYAKAIPAALAGPITLVIGSILGGLLTTQIAGDPAMLAGIMGFGTSALLFMVAEEILLEAHEDGEHVWWVDVQLYTGFYWGFMSTKFVPA
mmetsp:Transcript_11450/g.11165  ORF Transcript_11450/g.11165 Transcript_11450/m.11165 type:complete len:191 (-) Transcript_11450:308-880(-)